MGIVDIMHHISIIGIERNMTDIDEYLAYQKYNESEKLVDLDFEVLSQCNAFDEFYSLLSSKMKNSLNDDKNKTREIPIPQTKNEIYEHCIKKQKEYQINKLYDFMKKYNQHQQHNIVSPERENKFILY